MIIALSRYGGLRCPSEHLSLTLDDVDWERGRVHITSPKTARHAGHESRIIPLFPELRPYLEAVFDAAPPGTKHFITRYRDTGSNLRTHMTRLVKRAGIELWPRIFHNLRSSRQTELEEKFPSHVVCKWMGNSQQVARKHYLQMTDEHFERALEGGAKSGADVAQNQAQQTHAQDRTNSQCESDERCKALTACEDTRSAASRRDSRQEKMAEVHGNRTHRSHG
ncbi:MAG TPA: tyrosine-type recombinase/integrase [Pirellulaceae bacterium]|nr:tyrosine-type recombinase/integrase [Pirellulaceae bacterium]